MPKTRNSVYYRFTFFTTPLYGLVWNALLAVYTYRQMPAEQKEQIRSDAIARAEGWILPKQSMPILLGALLAHSIADRGICPAVLGPGARWYNNVEAKFHLTSFHDKIPLMVENIRYKVKIEHGVELPDYVQLDSMTKMIFAVATPEPVSLAPEKQTFLTAGHPWENTLGMKFVSVPETEVLFSIWDTRVQDYEKFASATRREWPKASFEQGPTHPAVNVNWEDAQAFCEWLIKKEQAEGRLGPDQKYRLPTDAEWSVAVGLDEPRAGTPKSKDGQIKGVYPWGTQWPPPRDVGIYAHYPSSLNKDDVVNSTPVGSFAANKYGLYDMGGTVWQWCEDFYDDRRLSRVLRGASIYYNVANSLLSSFRRYGPPSGRSDFCGFRCVVVVGGASAP